MLHAQDICRLTCSVLFVAFCAMCVYALFISIAVAYLAITAVQKYQYNIIKM